jgi:predicted RNA-binding Zn-ribbon protein involved in translation (DUF1610 family)
MTARDVWTLELNCPNCGNQGTADVSEGNYPFLQDTEFSVETIHGAFSVHAIGRTAFETRFKCDTCGTLLE